MSKLANLHRPVSEEKFWEWEATSADFYGNPQYWACRECRDEAIARIDEQWKTNDYTAWLA